ncbi:extracellular solute-binding protein [Pantanalinema sp. GBBB05]|uniref:extracellular solute-binding protein n=1 Tax=Pantanalinema sp. GBBB05 TaxID=2604139 RepID=UPI001D3B1A51|nr:extracellular solute-binding protein [Pantanalinema sp. GBBB05]
MSIKPPPFVPISRRSLLTGVAGWTASQLLAGCSNQAGVTLTIQLLQKSIPLQVLSEFTQANKTIALQTTPQPQLQSLFEQLQAWQRAGKPLPASSAWHLPDWIPLVGDRSDPSVADLVALGDYWLDKAIQQGLIQPLEPKQIPNWQQLDPRWQALVTRRTASGKAATQEQVWAAPYRWGSTVIAYRQDVFAARQLTPPSDWSDLWRSDLRGRISLLDQPREVIGLTLKKLGKSYNTQDLEAIATLKSELLALQQNIKFYSSTNYLQPLLLEDTWVAVGWSQDILPWITRSQQIAAIVPRSGTALWADLWVRPASSPTTTAAQAATWINFCWQPHIANQITQLSQAASPITLTLSPEQLPTTLQNCSLLLPDRRILQASEFLQPLPEPAIQQYQALWEQVRQAGRLS